MQCQSSKGISMPIRTREPQFADRIGSAYRRPLLRRRHALSPLSMSTLVLLGLAMHASSQTMEGSVIAGGGGRSASSGNCFRLDATIGQPLAGVASGGSFTLVSGFLPGRGDTDSIFHHGFEVCS
jgi:hypothetical protein